MTATSIRQASPEDADTAAFLDDYIATSRAAWPEHGDYVLDPEELKAGGTLFWTLSAEGRIAGCVAMKRINGKQAEIKSLNVDPGFRGHGFGRMLVEQVIDTARTRGFNELLLETGSMDYYAAARKLYAGMGFEPCGVFGDYRDDPASRFMRLAL